MQRYVNGEGEVQWSASSCVHMLAHVCCCIRGSERRKSSFLKTPFQDLDLRDRFLDLSFVDMSECVIQFLNPCIQSGEGRRRRR